MRFKPGQEIVCVDDKWIDVSDSSKKSPAPKYNEICVVDYYCGRRFSDGHFAIHIIGYDACFGEDAFEPIVSSEVIEKELNEICEPQLA